MLQSLTNKTKTSNIYQYYDYCFTIHFCILQTRTHAALYGQGDGPQYLEIKMPSSGCSQMTLKVLKNPWRIMGGCTVYQTIMVDNGTWFSWMGIRSSLILKKRILIPLSVIYASVKLIEHFLTEPASNKIGWTTVRTSTR